MRLTHYLDFKDINQMENYARFQCSFIMLIFLSIFISDCVNNTSKAESRAENL